jgi:sec-independent protein translocase protein TatA
MNVFGVGLPELAVIAAIGLLVFGPKRLPELGKTLGRTLKGFQSASSEFEKEFRKAVDTVEAGVTSTSVLPAEQAQAAAPEPSAQPQASSDAPEHSSEA